MTDLDAAARRDGGRIVAALAARYRDLDLAEDAFADACVEAIVGWPTEAPNDPSAWLYRVAQRKALDMLRRRRTRERLEPEQPPPDPTPEEQMIDDARQIPDERLRLIFVCCHPAVAPEARAALTLRLVCSLSTAEIARAFLIAEKTLAQRLTRAKRKIAEAGVSFEIPGRDAWPERLDAVLSTIEIAYAKAHEDAAGAGAHAGYAREMLDVTRVLVDLLPVEGDVLALAAFVRYAEARRPARLDPTGVMTPLSDQDPALWHGGLIAEGNRYIARADAIAERTPRYVHALIHAAWCSRRSLREPPPWRRVLALYDVMLELADTSIVRLNRAVALAEMSGPQAALDEIDRLDAAAFDAYLPYHAARADLLKRLGKRDAADVAYARSLELHPPPAERLWLERRREEVREA